MSSTDAVSVTTVVDVDAATAFEVFTTEVDAWWRRGPRFRFRPHENGVMRFEPGVGGRLLEIYDESSGDAFEVGRVLVWEPAVRLVFEFRARAFQAHQHTEVEVRFEPAGRGTRVTLEHRGWDALPPDHPARHGMTGRAFVDMIGLWWAEQLAGVKAAAVPRRRSAPAGPDVP